MEVLARHLLLLAAVTDWEVPVRHRANAFLELFGNTLVQRRTAKYISTKGRELENLLCDGVGSETLRSLIDFSLLKHRERDEMQRVFKSWDTSVPFNAQELHDRRLRVLYKDRYDFRKNVIDGDGEKPIGSLEHVRPVRPWRQTGVAFEFGDQQYVMPNRSMSSYAEGKERGRSMLRRGLWNDIVCSPYIAVGIDSETPNEYAEEIFDIYNQDTGSEQHRHHAVEVAVHNIVSALYEIETGNVYRMARAHDVYSGLGEKRKKKTREQVEKEVEEAKRKLAEAEAMQKAEAAAEAEAAAAKKKADEEALAAKDVEMEFDATTEKFTKVQIEADSDDDPDTDEDEDATAVSEEEAAAAAAAEAEKKRKAEELDKLKLAARAAEEAAKAAKEEEESEEERTRARQGHSKGQNIVEVLVTSRCS